MSLCRPPDQPSGLISLPGGLIGLPEQGREAAVTTGGQIEHLSQGPQDPPPGIRRQRCPKVDEGVRRGGIVELIVHGDLEAPL
jgi:hypothetical protein